MVWESSELSAAISVSEDRANACNHRAATSDCPFENARLRGSGALLCYATICGVVRFSI